MKRKAYILFVLTLSVIRLVAQTPYDSFAPESTRPMIEREALHQDGCMQAEEPSTDTVLCVAVVDMQQQTLLLINIYDNTIIGSAPLSDDILKWLSVDPLADKYIYLSPYMYCNGNPIFFVDPDGRFSMENINGDTNYKTILVLPSDQVLDNMNKKSKETFIDTYNQARSKQMPLMRVDNAKDYANAMEALKGMNSNTDSYVLSTSHGQKGSANKSIMIGSDVFTNKKGDFSQFSDGLNGKIVFITACRLAANESGVNLIEKFANATGSTVIGAMYPIPALLGGFCGGTLSCSPIRNAICGFFGGSCENSFMVTNGKITNMVYGVTIDKNQGILWKCK